MNIPTDEIQLQTLYTCSEIQEITRTLADKMKKVRQIKVRLVNTYRVFSKINSNEHQGCILTG